MLRNDHVTTFLIASTRFLDLGMSRPHCPLKISSNHRDAFESLSQAQFRSDPVQAPSSPTSIFSPNNIQLIPPNHAMIARASFENSKVQTVRYNNSWFPTLLYLSIPSSWSIFIQLGQVLFISAFSPLPYMHPLSG